MQAGNLVVQAFLIRMAVTNIYTFSVKINSKTVSVKSLVKSSSLIKIVYLCKCVIMVKS